MKRVNIEWRHLVVDGETCERCGDTGTEVRRAVGQLNAECAGRGYWFELIDTPLHADAIEESNAILIDGQRLEAILPQASAGSSECTSCGTLTGAETACRTVEVGGASYEAIPTKLIREAVCRVVPCCEAVCDCG